MRLRRRAGGPRRRRAVRASRRAGEARRGAELPGRLQPRPRGSHPAAVLGCAESHSRNRPLLKRRRARPRAGATYDRARALRLLRRCRPRGAGGRPQARRAAIGGRGAGAHRRQIPRGRRLSAGSVGPVLRLRSAGARRARPRRAAVELVGDRAHRRRRGPDSRPDGVRRRAERHVRGCRRAEQQGAHPDLHAGRVPHRRLPAAGPAEDARRPRQHGAERHRLAAVHRHVDSDVAA